MLGREVGSGLCDIVDLGIVPYVDAWQLQKQLATRRAAGDIPDTLLLLEHPHTYTLGSRGKREHLLVPQSELAAQAIPVLDVDRGGDITYHGPGQLVVYPILWLKGYDVGIVQYLRLLEAVLIELCTSYDLTAERIRGYTGAWAGDTKVAAIGAKVDVHGITRHGCALNVNTDLRYFDKIVPCGIRDRGVTSLAQLLGHPVAMDEVKVRFVQAFDQVFEQYIGRQG
ncbi:MAG: lipoyl(octanoyl) transferase LipB [Herpetosiphonaceae bacterium]|nr:lipoyl(octanoyl) transferase LipB [Herpetosiphonaceae bacterium]